MIVCGVEFSGNEARVVLLKKKENENFFHLDVQPRKIVVSDDEDTIEVRAFRDSLYAFFRENKVEHVLIKKRGKKGVYAGGPIGFKLEGIVQLYEDCPVVLVPPPTIAAAQRKHSPPIPPGLKKYQKDAFETAFVGML